MWCTLIFVMRMSIDSRRLQWPTVIGLFSVVASSKHLGYRECYGILFRKEFFGPKECGRSRLQWWKAGIKSLGVDEKHPGHIGVIDVLWTFFACKVILLLSLPYLASGLVENNFRSLKKKEKITLEATVPTIKQCLHSVATEFEEVFYYYIVDMALF